MPLGRKRHAVAPEALGEVQGIIDARDKIVRRFTRTVAGNAERHGDLRDLLLIVGTANPAAFDRRAQFFRERLRAVDAGIRKKHDELLAAKARRRILALHARLQDLRDGTQHLVADEMPVGVVDLLEMVDVRKQQAGSLGVRPFGGQTGGQRQIESAPVGQPG